MNKPLLQKSGLWTLFAFSIVNISIINWIFMSQKGKVMDWNLEKKQLRLVGMDGESKSLEQQNPEMHPDEKKVEW